MTHLLEQIGWTLLVLSVKVAAVKMKMVCSLSQMGLEMRHGANHLSERCDLETSPAL